MPDRIAELRSESRDLLALLQRLGDGEHDDLSVAHDALAEIINLRLQRVVLLDCAEALRALLSYTKACEELLNVMPAGQIHIAEEALAKLNRDNYE